MIFTVLIALNSANSNFVIWCKNLHSMVLDQQVTSKQSHINGTCISLSNKLFHHLICSYHNSNDLYQPLNLVPSCKECIMGFHYNVLKHLDKIREKRSWWWLNQFAQLNLKLIVILFIISWSGIICKIRIYLY